MKKNKLVVAFISLMSVLTLTACSGNKDIVTMKGGKITVDEFYDEVKTDPNVQNNLRNMIVFKVAEDNYGDKVDKKQVDKEFNDMKKQLGENFKSQLEMSGMTEASYKDQLMKGQAFQEMIKSHVKVNDKDLKTAWATFHPTVEAQLIKLDDEAKAKEVLAKVKNKDDFGKLAKTTSTDPSSKNKGTVKFDSSNQDVPQEVKDASYKLKNGETSEIVTVAGNNGYEETKSFYIVKMVKNKDKGNDMKPYKKELKKIVETQKASDQEFITKVVGKELKDANIKIKDDSLKTLLAGYIEEDKKPSDKKKDSKTENKKDDKKTDASKETKDSKK